MLWAMGRLQRPRPSMKDWSITSVNRGNNRAEVFGDDADRVAFLDAALARTRDRYPFRLFGYCLMPDHFHLLLRPESGAVYRAESSNRSRSPQTGRYTPRAPSDCIRATSGRGGSRARRSRTTPTCWWSLRYIEANPLRAKVVSEAGAYRWSSYPCHGLGQEDPS